MSLNLDLSSNFHLLLQFIGLSVSLVFVVPLAAYIYYLFALSSSHIPGPRNQSFFLGNLKEVFDDENASIFSRWIEQYGRVHKRATFFGRSHIVVADLKGVSHILKNDYDYVKTDELRYLLGRLTGLGIFVVEQDEHRKQRRIMNPAFEPAQIRGLTKIFVEKSIELRDAWTSTIENDGVGRVDALMWLTRMTLDVIGQAGFNYDFHSLQGEPNELNIAFSHVFESGTGQMTLSVLLKIFFPILRLLPESNRAIRQAQNTIHRIGKQLLADSKSALAVDAEGAKDVFSLLVRSNMSKDLQPNQRMSDAKILAQVPTFLAAGHETTSTATTWTLFGLTGNIEAQTKLRREVLSVPTEMPTMEQLNALPYLDAVVREALRLYTPVTETDRVVLKDDVIPLNEPFTDKNGVVHHELRVKKGQQVTIPIIALNRDKKLWGEDANEFKPERWEKLPDSVSGIPGIVNNLMTFLGGAHACIGWRFSLVEMKALLFVLVRSFEFELAVPREDLLIKQGIPVQRPLVRGGTNELPVLIKLVNS
ncbi:cytochrome p450 [Moniliophthora roreri MCA 2997]|uniref:Cytochrome p450 n=1 Tax=Moniliophthora roreri (strain MCA 2997) TaxID=1381753 RepID=V2X4S1_MONRO|nr:cytochrome p450 [Moniliophthora roreri MCA 2997]